MLEIQLPEYEHVCCRYCLSDEDEADLVAPCQCKGSAKYVHKRCLKEWFAAKNNSMVIPGYFTQFNQACEICHTSYKLKYKNAEPGRSLNQDIFVYICGVTITLFSFYMAIGLLLEQFDSTRKMFTERGTMWENIFFNGFIMTHIILGAIYLVISFVALTTGSRSCCFVSYSAGDCEGDACIYTMVIVGILGTVLMLYFDIMSRVVQRHQNRTRVIDDIEPY